MNTQSSKNRRSSNNNNESKPILNELEEYRLEVMN
jgi:hypothetical protein